MSDRDFDVVIIGAGLGGLQCAAILASEGRKVCVLEQNSQLGGSLQVFSRHKTLFDTGVHYLGGLDPGQNLDRYFRYLGIRDDLRLHRMDRDGADRISFDGEPRVFPIAQGYENFVQRLLPFFPKEEAALRGYVQALRETCDRFPLYRMRYAETNEWEDPALRVRAVDRIAALTPDPLLRAVLGAGNVLHGGRAADTPFHVHALVQNSYIESAWRCIDGGSRIAKALAGRARANGAVILPRKRVVALEVKAGRVDRVRTADGDVFTATTVIADIHPEPLLGMLTDGALRPAYVNRVRAMANTIATFTVHLALEPGSFPYLDHNRYHFASTDVWRPMEPVQPDWPRHYMFFTPMTARGGTTHAEGVSIMVFMPWSAVAPWAGSRNTVAEPGERGMDYEAFKQAKAAQVIDRVSQQHPALRQAIREVHASTPLTFRDYIGAPEGTTYGIQKDALMPGRTYLSPRTRVENLLLTGQNINFHGILGVTVSAVVTCAELVGKRYLVEKIQRLSGGGEVTVAG